MAGHHAPVDCRGLPLGRLLGRVYLVFLSVLMTALSAKIVAMGLSGVNIIPAVFIIPATTLVTLFFAYITIKPLEASNAASPVVASSRS